MIVNLHEQYDYFIFKDKSELNSGDIFFRAKNSELFYMVEASLLQQRNVFLFKGEVIPVDMSHISTKRLYVENGKYIFLSPRARFFFKNETLTINDFDSFETLEKEVSSLK